MKRFAEFDELYKLLSDWRGLMNVDEHNLEYGGAQKFLDYAAKWYEKKCRHYFNEKELGLLIEKLKRNEHFSLLSYGDGEWSFILDRKADSKREKYLEKTREELISALLKTKEKNVYLTTIFGGASEDGYQDLCARAKSFLKEKGVELKEICDARLFYDLLIQIKTMTNDQAKLVLKEFLATIKNKDIVLVGGKHLREVQKLIPYKKLIVVPTIGANYWIEWIVKEILNYGEPAVYLFSCGIAANIVIAKLHNQIKESSLIDIGAFWDFLFGIGTRKIPQWPAPLIDLNDI